MYLFVHSFIPYSVPVARWANINKRQLIENTWRILASMLSTVLDSIVADLVVVFLSKQYFSLCWLNIGPTSQTVAKIGASRGLDFTGS